MLQRSGMRDALRVPQYRALLAAEVVSILGDQLARVALALLVFDRTSSALLTGLTYALTFAPAVIGGWLLSGLADRFPRRDVIVLTDLVRAVLAGGLAIPAFGLPVLWTLVGLLSFASAPFKAAQLALLPDVLPAPIYQAGLALRTMSTQTAQVIGFGIGGALVAFSSPRLVLMANAVTFLFSAGLVWALVQKAPKASAGRTSGSVLSPEGPAVPRAGLVVPLMLASLIGLTVVPEGLAAPYVAWSGGASAMVGVVMAADPVGSVIGAWWAGCRRRDEVSRFSVILPAALSGLPLLACGWLSTPIWAVLLWGLSGMLATIYLIRLQALLVATIPDARRGTVLGRFTACIYASQGVAVLGGGVLSDRFGPIVAVASAGAVMTSAVALIGVTWKRARRPAESDDEPVSRRSAQTYGSRFTVTSGRTGGAVCGGQPRHHTWKRRAKPVCA